MTNFTFRMTIAAATLLVAAGAASAQTLKAEIPFTFRAGDKLMTAGAYRVDTSHNNGGAPVFRIRSMDGSDAVLVMAASAGDAKKAWRDAGNAVLAFECAANRCALTQLYDGTSAPAYKFHYRAPGKDEPTRTAYVVMRPYTGD